MKTDILNTTQKPDELHRQALRLLDEQAQCIHTLEAEKNALENHIHNLNTIMQAEKSALEQRIRELEEALKLAQQWRFGRKSERLPAASQKPLADLPRKETTLAPDTGSTCPDCSAAMRHIRDGVNEVPEYVPAHFVVKRTVRPQYGCPCCETVHSEALLGAITYALKRLAALTTYLDDGRVPVDNNRCEQMMRLVAQGRKSWLSRVRCGAESGWRSC